MKPNFDFVHVKSFDQRMLTERDERLGFKILQFGIPYLDQAVGGLHPKDLAVIAARSGNGKTQLAVQCALENARLGYRVLFIALEAEEAEIERRIKYQLIADAFFALAQVDRPAIDLNYLDWVYGRLDRELRDIEAAIESNSVRYPTLKILYRSQRFGAREFEKLLFAVKDDVDLVICDHIHYFDSDDENENRALKQIMMSIRDSALIAGKPVILVAHVRKTDRRTRTLVPELEDIHGSSDIAKIATKVITLARKFDSSRPGQSQTYISIQKCRVDGERMGAVGLLGFNCRTQRYEREYYCGRLSLDGTEFEPHDFSTMPFWAKSGIPMQSGDSA